MDDDIVVTANRTESLLSKTPIAISAVTGDQLRRSGATNTTHLTDIVPDLSIVRAGNGMQITIRGVTSTDLTEKGDPSTAFLVDGIYIARPQAQDVSFFDIERIEVLRGPQGTLYGRNTTAGVINLISAEPKQDFQASGDVVYESYNHVTTTGMVNVPLGDALAIRAAVNYDRRDSFIDREATDGFSIDPFRDTLSTRLSLLAKPTDRLKVVIRGDYARIKGVPTNSVPASNFFTSIAGADGTPIYLDRPSKQQRHSTFGEAWQGSRDNRLSGVMGQVDWDLDDFALTYLGSYRRTKLHDRHSYLAGHNRGTYDGNFWQVSQELRLAYASGPVQAQVGGYYFKEKGSIAGFVLDPENLGFPAFAWRYGFVQDPAISINTALFGQATIEIAPRLRLTGGVRYSHDDKSRVGATVLDTLPAAGVPDDRIILQVNNAHRTFSHTTWRAGVDYDVPGLGLIYATVSTGYKAGGFNDGCEATAGGLMQCTLPASALYYGPETLTAYEGGFKFRFGPAFRLEAAAFHYDYSGLQLSTITAACGGPCQITTNSGIAKIDGVELSAVIRPNRYHQFDIQANYLNARYTDFNPVPGVSYAGRPLDRSPKFSVNASYTFTHPLPNGGSIVANARTRFSSRYNLLDLANRIFFYQPAFTKTDLSLTYNAPEKRYYLGIFARNIEGNIVLTSVTNGLAQYDANATFEDPRTLGIRAGFRF